METIADIPASSEATSPDTPRNVQMRLQLKATDHAEQPVFSNFTTVQGAPGMVFLDFGFLEPAMLPGLARLAQSGGRMPGQVNGRLACRVVLGLEAAAQLARQIEQQLGRTGASPLHKPN